jgi:RNA polymerase sigma-70 factor (ECF subfamily)
MTPSFLDLVQRLETGDTEAAALLFDRYARRLIGLARRRLDERVRSKADADDVVNSVIRTFCRRAAECSFNLDGPDALCAVWVEITLRKCGRWNRHFRTRKPSTGGVRDALAGLRDWRNRRRIEMQRGDDQP